MNFQPRDSHSKPLFKFKRFLKFEYKTLIADILLTLRSINKLLLPIFNGWFTFCSDMHTYHTVLTCTSEIKPSYATDSYRKKSITAGANNC